MSKSLFRHAFVLILFSLVGGLFVPVMPISRLGLAAHTIGLISGVLLISIGAIWEQFRLSSAQAAWHKGFWVYSSYANWLAAMMGAVYGGAAVSRYPQNRPILLLFDPHTGGLNPAAEYVPSAVEAISFALNVSVVVTAFGAVGLALWGLRGERPA